LTGATGVTTQLDSWRGGQQQQQASKPVATETAGVKTAQMGYIGRYFPPSSPALTLSLLVFLVILLRQRSSAW
jgi:hypothetical protein